MQPSYFISDDLSEICLEDLFQPSSSSSSSYLHPSTIIQNPPSVGQRLKDDMELFQDLCPSLDLSSGQWRPPDTDLQDPMKTLREEETPTPLGKEEFQEYPVASDLWMSELDGFSGVDNGDAVLTHPGFSWTPSAMTVPVELNESGTEVICGSNEAKVKLKEKVTTGRTETKKKGVAKVGCRVGGGRRRAASSSSAAGPGASSSSSAADVADDERRLRRQESNRRAAERYRTKLKASAVDVATERHRLMDENHRLSQQNSDLRGRLSVILTSIQNHLSFCSAPFHLSEQLHLQTFRTPDAPEPYQIGSNSADPFQMGSATGTALETQLLVENRFVVTQDRFGPVDTNSIHGNDAPMRTRSVPLMVAEPLLVEDEFQENTGFGCLGQLRVIGLYANSSVN